MVKIRLKRMGSIHNPHYRLIVVEGAEHEIVQGVDRRVFGDLSFAGRSGCRCGQFASFT